jgi:hypothetical protein
VSIQFGVAPATLWLGGKAAGGLIGCHEPDHERHGHLEMPGGGMTGMAGFHKPIHPFAQIERVGLGHRSSPPQDRPEGEVNHERLTSYSPASHSEQPML